MSKCVCRSGEKRHVMDATRGKKINKGKGSSFFSDKSVYPVCRYGLVWTICSCVMLVSSSHAPPFVCVWHGMS